MSKSHEFGPLFQQLTVDLELKASIFGKRYELKAEPKLLSQDVPRHEIGVVFHFSEQDAVTGAQIGPPPAAGYQVDGLSSIAREDKLTGGGSPHKIRHPLSCGLIGRGRLFRERMYAAMDVGVLVGVEGTDRFYDLTRFLRGGGRIEVDQANAGANFPG